MDGICSGDILVLRTKDENILSQEILPYLFTNSIIFKPSYKLLNWDNIAKNQMAALAKHEIYIPSPEEQKQIASLFQSIDTIIERFENQEVQSHKLEETTTQGSIR